MKNNIYVAFFILATVFYNGEFYISKWTIWQIIGTLYFGYRLFTRYGLLASACFCWPVINAILIYESQAPITLQTAPQIISIENVVLRATMCWVISIGVIASLSKENHLTLEKAFGWFCIIDSLFVLAEYLYGIPVDYRNGLLGVNASLNACLIAVASCFIPKRYFAIPLIGVFLSGTSIPLGALAIVWGIRLISNYKLCLTYLISLCVGAYFFTPQLLNNSGRFWNWQHALMWWSGNANHWLGTGNGTFFIIGPLIHKIYQSPSDMLFIWAHNDWLEVLLTQGFIGLGLFMALFLLCVWKSRKENYILACVIAYGAVSCLNFPAHNPLFAILGILLAARSLDKGQHENT